MGCGSSGPSSTVDASTNNRSSGARPQSSSKTPYVQKYSETPTVDWKQIQSAVRWNKLDDAGGVRELLDRPMPMDTPVVGLADPSNGNLPLHIAAQNGHGEIVALLLERGAVVNAPNAKGQTAMHMAVGYDYYEVMKQLIEAGGDKTAKNHAGVPASRGLEGDKCEGLCAFISAKNLDQVQEAFGLCEDQIEQINKVEFVKTGLRQKKEFGAKWTDIEANRFKKILAQLK